ncbi:MAG: nitrilase-related carbon-nitrogen hydrolase [Dehalococcoidia bacterium]
MPFTAAAIQLGPSSPTIGETATRIVSLLQQAGDLGVKLASLPELALTPYFAAEVHESVAGFAAKEENDEALSRVSEAAKAQGISMTLPLAEFDKEQLFNSMAVLDADGSRKGTFRKVHIPGQVEPKEDGSFTILEKRYFTPGDLGFGVFETQAARLGGLICYDRRFPESYRALQMQGAEVICIGYNTPVTPNGPNKGTLAKGRRASELAMRAGAYFTGSYVLAAGKAGVEGGVRYIGGSIVIAPDGEIIKRARTNGDEVVAAEIDLERVAAIRKRLNHEENRRPELYI